MAYADVSALLFPADGSEPTVEAHVDRKFRSGCARALKAELGEHVTQTGLQVTSNRLRFDFARFGALTVEEMGSVEARVNKYAAAELVVTTIEKKPSEAVPCATSATNMKISYVLFALAVMMLQRTPRLEYLYRANSAEEHTYTMHVKCFPLYLVSEGSVAAGTRRVEAVAGQAGVRYLQAKAETRNEVAETLSTTPDRMVERVTKLQKQLKQLENRAQMLGDVVLLGSQIACIANAAAKAHASKLLQQVIKLLGGHGDGNARFAPGSVPAEHVLQEMVHRVVIEDYYLDTKD
ncbi:hypothetical protein DD238_004304 [Peronospora effusa]|uniref:Uncharacterized protein n=1 Tax=Peronospora effusa TaxID=542832 RepID=A0A3M6V7J9_9STRA|nr:hypothetical protein DD238_004304 [Peronospora effusa]RQM09691.1 hypothetical protein DD237_006284 [Peronospora effusa]